MVCRLGRVAVIVEVRLRREARVSVRATEEHTVALENVSTLPPVERMCFCFDELPSVSRVSSVTFRAICIREQAALL